jgi:uncharacterized membrane protein
MALRKIYSGRVNVADWERWASAIGGGALMAYGIAKKRRRGIIMAVLGGALLDRGIRGKSVLYNALGINTASRNPSPVTSVKHQEGVKIESAIVIHKPVHEIYRFWRHLENLPSFMEHLESVKITGPNESHWIAKGPAGTKIEWDAVIHNEIPDELIAWRSIEGSEVDHAGSVHFEKTPDGRSTEVRVIMNYSPPAGRLGAAIAGLFGEEPGQQIDEDLRRLKNLVELPEGSPTFEDETPSFTRRS